VSFRRWRAVRRCDVAHGRVPKGGRGPQDDENGDKLFSALATSDGHDHHLPPPFQHYIDEPTHAMI
jgi:hypothetical protein